MGMNGKETNKRPIKALSIKQPWAWLICAGYKDIENRSWFIGRKPALGGRFQDRGLELPQRIYVHAGKKDDWSEDTEDFLYHMFIADIPLHIPRLGTVPEQFGAIIGEVDITGCVEKSDSPWFVRGGYGFTLANPALYDKPIPCQGALGFFKVKL